MEGPGLTALAWRVAGSKTQNILTEKLNCIAAIETCLKCILWRRLFANDRNSFINDNYRLIVHNAASLISGKWNVTLHGEMRHHTFKTTQRHFSENNVIVILLLDFQTVCTVIEWGPEGTEIFYNVKKYVRQANTLLLQNLTTRWYELETMIRSTIFDLILIPWNSGICGDHWNLSSPVGFCNNHILLFSHSFFNVSLFSKKLHFFRTKLFRSASSLDVKRS